ncbi:P-loop containing nucleoside triphosphate hydrolase protein [Colletotrichum navitas]|uniref:P-loop containing nucleoside triphosphate hydrolase protein n=1 Tax=Colletotrichum navitas TaxID=681940 RepID=A0AAD8PQJ6_9PEZI|nr:P-loop containing nucleoside triphosphate hydrolase protein [Colletotrichum navitas]KAK1573934.1 P-loop containing nucleoside triphosphate hydrolase protein [Colletotrichum navitas]
MAETTFNAGISARNAIAAPYAAPGGTNNFYFANDGPDPSRKPFSNVPFPPDPDFVERPRITEWLRDKCGRPAGRAALVGLGGIGKSQLAVSYAHEVRQGAPDTYVFWVHAGTRERFEEAYHAIANGLQLPNRTGPDADVVRLVYDWLCAEENGKWLMIVDNADDVNVFYPKPNAVQSGSMASTTRQPLASFLPQSINGKILVTSRSRDVAERLTGSSWNVLSINAMDEDQAHQLLRNKLQEAHDEEVAAELLQALEYMPLAITQAAAYILRRAPRMSPSTYLADFRKSEKKKASLLHRNMGDLRRDPSASNSIVTTWQMTFDSIRQERQSAADLLAFLSFFNPQGIPEWILLSYHRSKGDISKTETIINNDSLRSRDDREVDSRYGSEADSDHDSKSVRNDSSEDDSSEDDSSEDDSEVDEFEDDLNMLREFSLVTTTTQEGVFEMHPLVRLCTQIWLSTTENVRKWRRIFLHVMSREYPTGAFETWARCQELSFHIQSVVNDKPENKDDLTDFPQLLYRMGLYKTMMGKYKEAEQLIQQALKAFEKAFGKEHVETLWSVDCLAIVLQHQGRLEEAELMIRRALEGFEKAFGKEHIETLRIVDNLSAVLYSQGKLEEAEQMFRQVIEVKEKALGKGHRETLHSVWWLAYVYEQQSRLEEAYELYQRASNGYKVFEPDDPVLKKLKKSILSFESSITRREGCWIRNQ